MREATYGHLFTPAERFLLKRMQTRAEIYVASPARVDVVRSLEHRGYCHVHEGAHGRWLIASATPLGLSARADP